MGKRPLPPEAYLDLQIHLDNLRTLEESCRMALGEYVAGRLTRDDYLGRVHRQHDAQRAWRRRHRKYFPEIPA